MNTRPTTYVDLERQERERELAALKDAIQAKFGASKEAWCKDYYAGACGPDKPLAKPRTFDTGATRSPLGNKLQYEGYLSPIVIKRFAQYMKQHQTQSDGTQRDADNWQQGIPRASLIDSKHRHDMDLWLYQRGYVEAMEESIEEALCGILFNTMAYLKSVLDEK